MNKCSFYFLTLLISSSLASSIVEGEPSLSVIKAAGISDPAFKNLQICYECEFAPITDTHMKSDGSYDQHELLSEWAPDHDIYLLYDGAIPAGFCVVNQQSMIDPERCPAHDIAEFYITPIFRHLGYGTWFAHYIFKLYPGTWEIRQLPDLEKSVRNFWIAAIKSIAHINFEEIINHPNWHGFVQRFDI